MALTKHKLGEFIERIDCRNSDLKYGIDDVRGVSNTKEIQPTKANISNRSFVRFQIVQARICFQSAHHTYGGENWTWL